jgi:hypothetical protein
VSYQSINGLRAAGGLGGTTRQTPATFGAQPAGGFNAQGQQVQPQATANPFAAPTASYNRNAGMQSTNPGMQKELGAMFGTSAGAGQTAVRNPAAAPQMIQQSFNGGVNPGAAPQQQLPTAPAVQFDPNDPNNAALAGYMAQ